MIQIDIVDDKDGDQIDSLEIELERLAGDRPEIVTDLFCGLLKLMLAKGMLSTEEIDYLFSDLFGEGYRLRYTVLTFKFS